MSTNLFSEDAGYSNFLAMKGDEIGETRGETL